MKRASDSRASALLGKLKDYQASPGIQRIRDTLPGVDVIWGYAKGFIGYMVVDANGLPYGDFQGYFTAGGAWRDLGKYLGVYPGAKTNTVSLDVKINNLTPAQALAIGDMFRVWVDLGQMGSSRMVSFYADGDGNFRPKILVNGDPPEQFGTGEEIAARWKGDTYEIDFDEIAWKLREDKEAENPEVGFHRKEALKKLELMPDTCKLAGEDPPKGSFSDIMRAL